MEDKESNKKSLVERYITPIVIGVIILFVGAVAGGAFFLMQLMGMISTFDVRVEDAKRDIDRRIESSKDGFGLEAFHDVDGFDLSPSEMRNYDELFARDVAVELRPILEELAAYDKVSFEQIRDLENQLVDKFLPMLQNERARNRELQIRNSQTAQLYGEMLASLKDYGENYLRAIKGESLIGDIGGAFESTATLNWFKNLDYDDEREKLRTIVEKFEAKKYQIDARN